MCPLLFLLLSFIHYSSKEILNNFERKSVCNEASFIVHVSKDLPIIYENKLFKTIHDRMCQQRDL